MVSLLRVAPFTRPHIVECMYVHASHCGIVMLGVIVTLSYSPEGFQRPGWEETTRMR